MTINGDIDELTRIIKHCGDMARNARTHKLVAWEKADSTPVTEADIAIDKYLQETLMAMKPDYGWLSEESEDNLNRLNAQHLWVVDPIDGTRAYARGDDDYCISIGLLENNKPILGMLYVPDHDDLYLAIKGQGSFKNGKTLSMPSLDSLRDKTMIGDGDYFKSARTWPTPWPDSMNYEQANSLALRHAWVAEGKGDVVVTANPKCDWDLAAASLIITEAGGHSGDHQGADYQFNQENPRHFPVVACHQDLLASVEKRLSPALALRKERRLDKF